MSDERPILILYASAGSGHRVAACAVGEALERRLPDAEIIYHDVLQTTNRFFRTLYAQGYLGIVNHAPSAMALLYEATDRPKRNLRHRLRCGFQNMNARRTMQWLRDRRPGLIINTHFLSAEIVATLRRQHRLDCPQLTVTTDFETHRLWAQPPTERYFTATETGKAFLETWGVEPERVLVTGIPVRDVFNQAVDAAAMRAKLELDAERAVVLLLCGGLGVGPGEELLQELLTLDRRTQIVVIAGRNVALRGRLQCLVDRSERGARVIGFSNQMHEWMRAADLAVTKPGGLTSAEALVCGLPLVIINPIPGQESRNSDYLLEHGAAIKVNNARLLGFSVSRLLADPKRLAALREAALRLARPDASARIAADALRILSNGRR